MYYKSLLSRLFGSRATPAEAPAAAEPMDFEPAEHDAGAPGAEPGGHDAAGDWPPSDGEVQAADPAEADVSPGIVAGHVEMLSPDGASGWAFDAARPGRPVMVAAFLGATRLGHAVADGVREDLQSEIGEGVQGFHLAFSPAVSEAMLEHVHVIAASAGTPAVLRAPEPVEAVTEASHARPPQAPVFIIGAAPDAAALLTRSLVEAAGLAGHAEGQLLSLAQALIRTTNQFYRNALAAAGKDALVRQVESATIHKGIRDIFIGIMAGQHPQGDWVDNSQGLAGIQAALAMRTMWPGARFIFLSSRVIESVGMRAAAEPARSMSDNVKAWVRDMQAWLEIRDRFRHNSMAIDRLSLLRDPAAAAMQVGGFLQLQEGAQARLASALTQAVHAAGLPAAAGSHAGWDGEEGDALRAAAAPTMAAFGYVWDESYFGAAPALEGATP